jgi:glycosidase
LFSSGQEAGPVWLGYRTQSSETEGDYWLVIYKKGAWVLHMLRNMLIDLNTMNEDAFENMLREFFSVLITVKKQIQKILKR